ncbi:MAG: hypothetical protein JJ902_05370 [Roseibium sp.]|nr:hypothetical protein [Roseibium sp.]
MRRTATLALALFLAAPAAAETTGYHATGWAHRHYQTCVSLGIVAPHAARLIRADFSLPGFKNGYHDAGIDMIESMASDGHVDGIRNWCADPWAFYPSPNAAR